MFERIVQPFNRIRDWLGGTASPARGLDELRVLDNGAVYTDDGSLDYLWYHLEEGGRRYYKAVCLNVLTYLPRETRETTTLLEKMRKVLKGIYTAQVDFLYLVANVVGGQVDGVDVPSLGIVQVYGVQALAEELDAAVQVARQGLSAVRAAMANFEQSRLEPVGLNLSVWLLRALAEMPLALTVIGHPDPRTGPEGVRGMTGGSGHPGDATRGVGLQQNEYLFRGMAAAGHEFVNVVLISRMGNGDQSELYRLQERVAQELSIWASKEKFTRAITAGLSLPLMLSGTLGDGASSGYGVSRGYGTGESTGRFVSRAHTEGSAEGEAWGRAHTTSESWGTADTSGSSWSHTTGRSETVSTADGASHVVSEAHGTADTHGSGTASGSSWGSAVSTSVGHTSSTSSSITGHLAPEGIGVSAGLSVSDGVSYSTTHVSSSGGFSSSSSFSSHTDSHSVGTSDGVSHTSGHAVTTVESHSVGGFSSHTSSHGTGVSDTQSYTRSQTHSQADTVGTGVSGARSQMESVGLVRAQSLSRMQALGLGAGVAPHISFSKVYQGEDHVATLVADALRGQMAQLRTMALEGGVYVDNYFLCRTPEARTALETLIPLAFHGTEEVTTPVRPRRLAPAVEQYIRLRALTFTPSNRPSRLSWVLEPWADTTLLTMLQAATYVAPGAFEQGRALTVQEQAPPFAFYPDMPGEVVLGHQYSVEISLDRPTNVPVRLSRERMGNWAVCADTRMGKSVLMEWLSLEVVNQWQFRVIVADFGAGWRKLVSVLPRERVDLWGLAPGSPRPIRWNPLQIGRRIAPEVQLAATVELLCNAGRMGERQMGFMFETLEKLYLDYGVLTHDPAVWEHERWGRVLDEERDALARAGVRLPERTVYLRELDDVALQALAVQRSKAVDVSMWYRRLETLMHTFKPGSTSRSAIEGILLRLRHLVSGRMAQMYGRGEGSLAIEDLALPYGLCILEGGAQMSQYAKAALLTLMSWHLYTDAVQRREEGLDGAKHAPMLLVLEEGNKIVAGVESGGKAQDEGPPVQSDIIPAMFRDAGKYQIYLAIIAQSPAVLSDGIISSCNCIAAGQLKNADDVKTLMQALARSPVGFVDTHYARFISRMPRGMFVLKLGLADDIAQLEPLLFRPLMVEAKEPGIAEVRQMFGLANV